MICSRPGTPTPSIAKAFSSRTWPGTNRKHKAFVLDEPSAEVVGRCKVFDQASMDGCELYQSAKQRYTRWYCVYNVPIIICTNAWPSDNVKIHAGLGAWSRRTAFITLSRTSCTTSPRRSSRDRCLAGIMGWAGAVFRNIPRQHGEASACGRGFCWGSSSAIAVDSLGGREWMVGAHGDIRWNSLLGNDETKRCTH